MTKRTNRSSTSTKKQSQKSKNTNRNIEKKIVKQVLKSPVLLAVTLSLVLGIAVGYVIALTSIVFNPLALKVNEVEQQPDYAKIDLFSIKCELQKDRAADQPITEEELASAVNFYDGGVKATFLGKSLSENVKKQYFYRLNLNNDAEQVDKIDFSKTGIYYIVYTCDHFAFADKKIVKTIMVTEEKPYVQA